MVLLLQPSGISEGYVALATAILSLVGVAIVAWFTYRGKVAENATTLYTTMDKDEAEFRASLIQSNKDYAEHNRLLSTTNRELEIQNTQLRIANEGLTAIQAGQLKEIEELKAERKTCHEKLAWLEQEVAKLRSEMVDMMRRIGMTERATEKPQEGR